MIYNMEIWTHFNSGVLRVPFSRWIPSSISVCSGENGRGSTLWLPLYFAHIYCNYIFLKFLLVALLLNNFFSHDFVAEELSVLIEDELLSLSKEQRRGTVIIVEGKLGEAGEVGVKLEDGGVPNWEPWRQPGGNTDNYTGAKFKIYTSLIVRSYHLENPLCITTWKMWK